MKLRGRDGGDGSLPLRRGTEFIFRVEINIENGDDVSL